MLFTRASAGARAAATNPESVRLLSLVTASALLVGSSVAASAQTPAPAPRLVGSPSSDCRATVAGLDLETATVADLSRAMATGRLTSAKLVAAYLDRIRAYDGKTNSVRALNAHALQDAARLDRERAAGSLRGPLHGVPVLLKDNIGTTDLPTTAGSLALKDLVPYDDAVLTARLRAAGAVVLGKTNLSEFANWVSLTMPNGYSSLGGQVREAYGLGDPSGSSSGSGVAGSMAFAAGTFGSETSGSILSPSSVNGLVGVKPTRGLVSRTGVIPLAEGFDTAGPMTRSVADAAALLSAVAGSDRSDPATVDAQAHLPAHGDYTSGLTRASLKGVRLGYSTADADGLPAESRALYATALADLRRLGATLVPTETLDTLGLVGVAETGLIPNDFHANLDHYLQTMAPTPRSGVHSLAEIAVFNAQHPQQVKYGQDLLLASVAQPGSRAAASAASLALRTASGATIDASLQESDLDALVGPGPLYANAGASAGYPTVIVPMGLTTARRPLGLSFLGTKWDERDLLTYAAAYEQGTHRRVPPTVVNRALVRGC
ncbi:MAG: gatA [Frankiales bacterium]|nr:gatA [Frankiales bacterium]